MQAIPGEIKARVILISNEMPGESTDESTIPPTNRLTTCFSVIPSLTSGQGIHDEREKMKFTPVGEGGSGWQTSATEDTWHFGRLNIKTVITVRSQLAEFETSGRFCLFVIW